MTKEPAPRFIGPCEHCGIEVDKLLSQCNTRTFCSRLCANTFRRGQLASPNSCFTKEGRKTWNKGLTKDTSPTLQRQSERYKGDANPMRRPECRAKAGRAKAGKSLSPEHRRSLSVVQKKRVAEGRNHLYIDGRTQNRPYYDRDRYSVEYKLWRTAVFTRDDWTCQDCHVRGGCLEAHHIERWIDCPERRFDVDNGQTLCRNCHLNTRRKIAA